MDTKDRISKTQQALIEARGLPYNVERERLLNMISQIQEICWYQQVEIEELKRRVQ